MLREPARSPQVAYLVCFDGFWFHLPPGLSSRGSLCVEVSVAIAQHKTQALSVLKFLEMFPERLWTETFHLLGASGLREGPWW